MARRLLAVWFAAGVGERTIGFERELRERDFARMGAGGWGLSIVDAESTRWGLGEGTTHVWFELELPVGRRSPVEESPST